MQVPQCFQPCCLQGPTLEGHIEQKIRCECGVAAQLIKISLKCHKVCYKIQMIV